MSRLFFFNLPLPPPQCTSQVLNKNYFKSKSRLKKVFMCLLFFFLNELSISQLGLSMIRKKLGNFKFSPLRVKKKG